jgi:hypothetical protein
MKNILSIVVLLLTFAFPVAAQHHHHEVTPPPKQAPKPKPVQKKKATPAAKPASAARPAPAKPAPKASEAVPTPPVHQHTDHADHNHATEAIMQDDEEEDTIMHDQHADHAAHAGSMSHILSLNLPMSRNASGTGWNPDNTPMYMYMKHSANNKWMYMLHGNVFIRYNSQDIGGKGTRGDDGWDAPSMIMAIAQRRVGQKGLFHAGAMISFDALITGQRGYPLLFQSGESAHGEPLVDRQHPHDLFSALEASYSYSFNKKSDLYIYLGYPGEPALGATTFMHRPSGWDNPDAPLSHHWVDATHISFGVATLGYRYGKFKLEASSFTGREPNENRYDFDKPRFDSRSTRLWFAPSKSWNMQLSHAYIKSPEELHAGEDVYRTTASASYSRHMGKERFFNATGLWGMNKSKGHDAEHAVLAEASLRQSRLVTYTRYEWVRKSGEELNLDEQLYDHHTLYPVNALTLGAAYDLLHNTAIRTSLGLQATLYHADKRLNPLYGQNPIAAEVYLRFYPNLMN